MQSAAGRGSACDLNQVYMGAETPQAPPPVRQGSPVPSSKVMMPGKILAPPLMTERSHAALMMGNDMSQSQLQVNRQAKAQAQIQAFQQAMQAQSYGQAVMQPPMPNRNAPSQQSQVQLGQPQAFAQMQQAIAQQQSMLGRQSASRPSLLQMQRQVPPQQQIPQSDQQSQMQRQLQEQMVAQVWAQTQVQQQRETPQQVQMQQQQQQPGFYTNRGGRQTLVRQASCARTAFMPRPIAPTSPPPPTSPPAANTQQIDLCRTSDTTTTQEPASARAAQSSNSEAKVPNADPDAELLPGVVVSIDGSIFEIMQPLGMGSYGMVWSAWSEQSKEVAVKEILCRSQGELSIAHFEGNLLHKLGHMEKGACRNGRLPALVAQETQATSSGNSWRVRLAMSRIPGMPLMILLEQHREYKKALQSDPAANGSQPPPEMGGMPQLQRVPGESMLDTLLRKLSQPSMFTRELIVQIFPTLERIAAVAFHRDINPRNILIDSPEQYGAPNYGLVDFGMAVDSGLWRADTGGNWNTLEVGGDCRYWPVSAWVMFLHGPQELNPGAPWRVEYQTQLDIHALGITALQVFVDLLPSAEDSANGKEGEENGVEPVLASKLKALTDAWQQYWEDAMDFWSCLIDCFTNNGDWNALKRACINHGVQEAITRDLSDLRTTLGEAAAICDAIARSSDRGTSEGSSNPSKRAAESARELESVFVAMRALISVGDSCQFPNWRTIHSILRLPASMEDLATARVDNGTASAKPGSMMNSFSTNRLSTSTLAPGFNYTMFNPATPGPAVTRGVSIANDVGGPKSSPPTARRQASVIRSSAPSGSSTHRMVSMVAAGSPMCSPRRPATVVVDTAGRQMSAQHSPMHEPMSSRRSGNTIAASPPGPSRTLMREASVTAATLAGQKSKSALAHGQSAVELPPPWWEPANARNVMAVQGASYPGAPALGSIVRQQSKAAGVVREYSVAALPEPSSMLRTSKSSALMRGGGMATVLTKNSSVAPADFQQNQVIRGSSVVAQVPNRSSSPERVGHGASVVIETDGAQNRALSVVLDTPLATARRVADFRAASSSYVSDIPGPSPNPGMRVMMQSPHMLSARQWVPMSAVRGAQGFTTTGSDIADQPVSGGPSLIVNPSMMGFASGERMAFSSPGGLI